MAALEYRVLTAILKEESFRPALTAGLQEDHFKDPEAKQIFSYLRDHWFSKDAANTVPSVSSIKYRWPAFEMTAYSAEDKSHVLALMKEQKMRSFESDVRSMANYFNELVEVNPEEAVKVMKASIAEVSYRLNSGAQIGMKDIANLAKTHYRGAQNGAIYGIPWPWECLTNDTLGKRPGNFIVFYGRMKSMKTWLLLFSAIEDYLVHNKRVLIWSREMDSEQLSLRCASILAKVDYQLFKKGALPKRLEDRAFKVLEELAALQMDTGKGTRSLKLLAGAEAPTSLDELAGVIAEFEPDVVYLDSFYHLRSSRSKSTQRWERIACLTEDVKALAINNKIPIVATHQANREGEKSLGGNLAEVADSDVIAREADLIARIIRRRGKDLHEDGYEVQEKEVSVSKKVPFKIGKAANKPVPDKAIQKVDNKVPRVGAELAIILGGNREGVLEAFTIHAIPGYNFKVINTQFSSDEIQQWVESDGKDTTTSKIPNKATRDAPNYRAVVERMKPAFKR